MKTLTKSEIKAIAKHIVTAKTKIEPLYNDIAAKKAQLKNYKLVDIKYVVKSKVFADLCKKTNGIVFPAGCARECKKAIFETLSKRWKKITYTQAQEKFVELLQIRDLVAEIRKDRAAIKEKTPERTNDKRAKDISGKKYHLACSKMEDSIWSYAHNTVNVEYDENILEPTFSVDTETCWKEYTKRESWPYTHYFLYAIISPAWRVTIIDDLLTIISSEHALDGDITISAGWLCMKKSRGELKINTEKTYVASAGDLSAHGKTVKKAVKALIKKIATDTKIKNLTMDSYVTPQDYREITGACRQGTSAWLHEEGLTWKSKISVRELCERMETHRGWGYEKFLKAINK